MSSAVASLHGAMFGVFLLALATFGRRVLDAIANAILLAGSAMLMFGGGVLFGFGRHAVLTLSGAALSGAGAAMLVVVVPGVVFAHQRETATQAMAVLNTFP